LIDCERADQNSQTTTQTAADENATRAIHQRMIDAWNAGGAEAFAAPLTEEPNFVIQNGSSTWLAKKA